MRSSAKGSPGAKLMTAKTMKVMPSNSGTITKSRRTAKTHIAVVGSGLVAEPQQLGVGDTPGALTVVLQGVGDRDEPALPNGLDQRQLLMEDLFDAPVRAPALIEIERPRAGVEFPVDLCFPIGGGRRLIGIPQMQVAARAQEV